MPTGANPSDFVVPGAAEVVDPDGVRLFAHATRRAGPVRAGSPHPADAGTRLRVTDEAGPATDGTRILAATKLGSSTSGFVRATGLAPRDSSGTVAWSLDRSGALLSPNDDGSGDALVVAARLSEKASVSFAVRNAAGKVVKRQSATGDIVRFGWNLAGASGDRAADGAYRWTFRAKDAWGNDAATASGSFTVDGTAPVSKAASSSTAGLDGWKVSPVRVTMRAADALSGVRSISTGSTAAPPRTYDGGVTITAQRHADVLEYRATDKAGIREAWHRRTYRIDTAARRSTWR